MPSIILIDNKKEKKNHAEIHDFVMKNTNEHQINLQVWKSSKPKWYRGGVMEVRNAPSAVQYIPRRSQRGLMSLENISFRKDFNVPYAKLSLSIDWTSLIISLENTKWKDAKISWETMAYHCPIPKLSCLKKKTLKWSLLT